MYSFTIDHSLGESDPFITGALIEVSFLSGFESARTLKYHISHRTDILEIKAIASNTVDPDVADHQHALYAFALRFGTHKPRKHLRIFGIRFDDGHAGSSLPFIVAGLNVWAFIYVFSLFTVGLYGDEEGAEWAFFKEI